MPSRPPDRRALPPESARAVDAHVTSFVRKCRMLAARLPDLEADERFEVLIDALHEAPSDCGSRAGRAVIAALIAELADRALRDVSGLAGHAPGQGPDVPASIVRGDGPHHPHVDRALDVLSRRATEPRLGLGAVAASVGISRWHLSRLLRSWTGRSFFGLLATLRVQEAKRLLAETSLSVKEVAARCGYEHVSHLDRQFRAEAGVTPGVYRALWQTRARG